MIWFITDNPPEFNELVHLLTEKNFSTTVFGGFSEVFARLSEEKPDAIIIDADRREISCMEFCWSIKSNSEYKTIKLIVCSGSKIESTEVAAFESGADEFIVKPIRILAVLKRILSRLVSSSSSSISCSVNGKWNLQIDRDSFTVYLNRIPVILSRKEFELLYLMASEPGKVFSRNEIFNKVWKKLKDEKDRTIDVHVLRLRKKLGDDVIYTHKGIGYRLVI